MALAAILLFHEDHIRGPAGSQTDIEEENDPFYEPNPNVIFLSECVSPLKNSSMKDYRSNIKDIQY